MLRCESSKAAAVVKITRFGGEAHRSAKDLGVESHQKLVELTFSGGMR
jgi:hypothetical protein